MNTLKKILRNGIAGIAMATLVAGCGKKITEGTIYGKVHEPANEWMQLIPIFVGDDMIINVPVWHYDDEDFIIKISKYNEEKRKYEKRTLYVDKQTFNRFEIGNYFVCDEKTEAEDPLVKRRVGK